MEVSSVHVSFVLSGQTPPSLVDRQTNMTKTSPLSILCMQAVKIPEYLRVLPQIRHKHWNFHRWQSRIVPLRSSSSIRGGKGGVCLHQEKRRCPLYSVGSRIKRWRIAYRMHCYCWIGGTRKVQTVYHWTQVEFEKKITLNFHYEEKQICSLSQASFNAIISGN